MNFNSSLVIHTALTSRVQMVMKVLKNSRLIIVCMLWSQIIVMIIIKPDIWLSFVPSTHTVTNRTIKGPGWKSKTSVTASHRTWQSKGEKRKSPECISKRKRVGRWCASFLPKWWIFAQPGFVWKSYRRIRWTSSLVVGCLYYARGCLGAPSSNRPLSLDSRGRVGVLWPLPESRREEWEQGSSQVTAITGNLELKFR